MKKIQPKYFTETEGGELLDWKYGPVTERDLILTILKRKRIIANSRFTDYSFFCDVVKLKGVQLHSSHGEVGSDFKRWDCVNGWTS